MKVGVETEVRGVQRVFPLNRSDILKMSRGLLGFVNQCLQVFITEIAIQFIILSLDCPLLANKLLTEKWGSSVHVADVS